MRLQALLGMGIHSATQIATRANSSFSSKPTAAGLTKRKPKQVYYAGGTAIRQRRSPSICS